MEKSLKKLFSIRQLSHVEYYIQEASVVALSVLSDVFNLQGLEFHFNYCNDMLQLVMGVRDEN